jgi:hypothetical protein
VQESSTCERKQGEKQTQAEKTVSLVIDLGTREKDLQHADLSRSTTIIIPRSRQTHLRITKCSIHVNDFPTAKKKTSKSWKFPHKILERFPPATNPKTEDEERFEGHLRERERPRDLREI